MLLRLPRFLHKTWIPKALLIGEIALAALLLASPSGVMAVGVATAALVLFVIYLVIIARAMTFTPRPNCGCFGRIGDQTVRARTVWRNGLFVAAALIWLVATLNGASVPGLLSRLTPSGWAWFVGALFAAVATWFVVGGGTNPLGEPHRPQPMEPVVAPVDEFDPELDYIRVPIPAAVLLDPAGEPALLTDLTQTKAVLLVMANCYCGPTYAAWDILKQARPKMPQIDTHMVFSNVRPSKEVNGQPAPTALFDPGALAWKALEVTGSPAAVLLGADGLLAGGPVSGIEEIEEFVREIQEALDEHPVVPAEAITVITEPGHLL